MGGGKLEFRVFVLPRQYGLCYTVSEFHTWGTLLNKHRVAGESAINDARMMGIRVRMCHFFFRVAGKER